MSSIKFQPVLWGGLLIGLLSAVPVVNTCCCLWMVCGGMLTAYLMQSGSAAAITVADGAIGGLLAGATGAVVRLVLGIPMGLLMVPVKNEVLRSLGDNPDVPQWARSIAEGGVSAIALQFVMFFLTLVLAAVFATVGGMVGAALFAKKAPTTPPPIPPPLEP